MTEVEYSDLAVEKLDSFEPNVAERVVNKVEEATEWTDHRLEQLTNSDYYKLRIGDYRAIIDWDRDGDVLFVVVVDHRDRVYDRYL
ncbi:type II toxin-antitoxin system RelE family toxin [Halovivax cerinus]|uniref:Type II toxin-antitoxin system RelE/ParE family toxin n=1 Tax=Halovivax cerinus TaxID=1487865 RepID=A0ABD5NKF4_9EURY|nr:type II toxin-antitoxin system RelE/ParE family toxin [Halovivax cerinus]